MYFANLAIEEGIFSVKTSQIIGNRLYQYSNMFCHKITAKTLFEFCFIKVMHWSSFWLPSLELASWRPKTKQEHTAVCCFVTAKINGSFFFVA